jgi:Pyruvate/2-oxoacid:ferredoxin oxidoreductase gamma subunit
MGKNKKFKIALFGNKCRGIKTISNTLVNSAKRIGIDVNYFQKTKNDFNDFLIEIGKISLKPFRKADIVICFDDYAHNRAEKYVYKNTIFIFDSWTKKEVYIPAKKIIRIQARKIAQEQIHTRSSNIILLGAIVKIINFPVEDVSEVMQEILKDKIITTPIFKKVNKIALTYGYMEINKYEK